MVSKRRFAVVVLGFIVLFLSAGLLVLRAQQVAAPARPRASATGPGRYQIVINPQVRADTFLLDTEAGNIWQPTQYKDLEGEPTVWELQQRIDTGAELVEWLKHQKPKAK